MSQSQGFHAVTRQHRVSGYVGQLGQDSVLATRWAEGFDTRQGQGLYIFCPRGGRSLPEANPDVKRQERIGAEAENEWDLTATSPYAFMAWRDIS